jgi:hypothetical protein
MEIARMNYDVLVAEMRALREQVTGITDTAVAAADGMLIAADTEEPINPEELAALAAASLGLARRTAAATGRGSLHQTVTHGSGGYTVVFAVGDTALMVVLGDEGLNIGRLHLESHDAIERIGSILYAPKEAR